MLCQLNKSNVAVPLSPLLTTYGEWQTSHVWDLFRFDKISLPNSIWLDVICDNVGACEQRKIKGCWIEIQMVTSILLKNFGYLRRRNEDVIRSNRRRIGMTAWEIRVELMMPQPGHSIWYKIIENVSQLNSNAAHFDI